MKTNDSNKVDTIKWVCETVRLLKKFDCSTYCKASDLAKELKWSKTKLMKYIEENHQLFDIGELNGKKVKKPQLVVQKVYENISDNPATDEYLTKKIEENKNVIELDYYNNYGHISGAYIKLSNESDRRNEWLNTVSKIKKIKEKYNLKSASFIIGGFGDSASITPEDGWELSKEIYKKLIKDGWVVLDYHGYFENTSKD